VESQHCGRQPGVLFTVVDILASSSLWSTAWRPLLHNCRQRHRVSKQAMPPWTFPSPLRFSRGTFIDNLSSLDHHRYRKPPNQTRPLVVCVLVQTWTGAGYLKTAVRAPNPEKRTIRFTICLCVGNLFWRDTICHRALCFTICLCISLDLGGYQGTKDDMFHDKH
jgi:hypothetical protein